MKILIQDPEDRNLSIKLSRTLSIKQRAASSTNHPSLQTSPYVHELGLRLAVNRVQRDHRFCSRPRPICLYLKILLILRQIPSPERQMHSRLMSVPVSLWYTPPPHLWMCGGWVEEGQWIIPCLKSFFTLFRLFLLLLEAKFCAF